MHHHISIEVGFCREFYNYRQRTICYMLCGTLPILLVCCEDLLGTLRSNNLIYESSFYCPSIIHETSLPSDPRGDVWPENNLNMSQHLPTNFLCITLLPKE